MLGAETKGLVVGGRSADSSGPGRKETETQSGASGRATDSEEHWPPGAASSWPGEVGAAGPGPA